MFKPPEELLEERVANAIEEIKRLEFPEYFSTDEIMLQLEEISAVS